MSDVSVIVYSRGGNTRMLADAIAEELGVKAQDVRAAKLDDAKVVFLGTGTYGGKPGKEMLDFIEAHDLKGRKVAIFYTSANPHGHQGLVDTMTGALKSKGTTLQGIYHCPGKFLLFMNRGRPNKEDMDNARKFAREMVK